MIAQGKVVGSIPADSISAHLQYLENYLIWQEGRSLVDIKELSDLLAKKWPFDADNYPELEGKSKAELRMFAIKHIILHQAKALGSLSEFVERYDHRKSKAFFDDTTATISVVKMFCNTLRLAEIIGLDTQILLKLSAKLHKIH